MPFSKCELTAVVLGLLHLGLLSGCSLLLECALVYACGAGITALA